MYKMSAGQGKAGDFCQATENPFVESVTDLSSKFEILPEDTNYI